MSVLARMAVCAVIAVTLPACERWSWPPYEKSLREVFAERKEQFEKIRVSMLADNLEFVDFAYARGGAHRCVGAGCPRTIGEHDELLQSKYNKLIEEHSVFYFRLSGGAFSVNGLPFPPMRGGDYTFQFVWSEERPQFPHCAQKKARLPSCGACYVNLDSNWYMYWQWSPSDLEPDWDGSVGEGLPTAEEIWEATEMAYDECYKAGWEEMGTEQENDTL